LQVEDDGPGITDTLAKSLLDEDTKNDHGYGIQNVNERIKINFGEEYGLEFQARAGTGTIVSIFLPLLRSIG
jgi:two-component system sensor histidine kinase YesM